MKLDKQTAKYYYTAAEARETLGLDEQAFQYWVRKGRIKRVMLPGRAQAVYSKREVNELASQITATIIAEQPPEMLFRRATIDDIDSEVDLAHLVFGEKAKARAERKIFIEKNPYIDYHVYDKDKLVAYIYIVPLEHSSIEDFMMGKYNAWMINPETIKQFKPGEPLECLIIDMITTPTVPPLRRAQYGQRLLSGVIQTLVEAGSQGVEIRKVYATSDTPDGIRIMKNAGFEIIHESRKGRFSFMLDIENSQEKILKEYKHAFLEWNEEQNAEKPVPKTRRKKPSTPNV